MHKLNCIETTAMDNNDGVHDAFLDYQMENEDEEEMEESSDVENLFQGIPFERRVQQRPPHENEDSSSSSNQEGYQLFRMAQRGQYDDDDSSSNTDSSVERLFDSADAEDGGDNDDDDECDLRMPVLLDFLNNKKDHREQYADLFQRLDALGQWTSKLIKECVEEDEAFFARLDEMEEDDSFSEKRITFLSVGYTRHELKKLFDAWRNMFAQHMEVMREITSYKLDPQHFGYDANGRRKTIKNTLGSHIFTELTLIKGLMHRARMLEEEETLLDIQGDDEHLRLDPEEAAEYDMLFSLSMTKHHMWVDITESFEVTYEEDEVPDERVSELLQRIKSMWNTPVYEFKQSEVITGILFLTQQLNEVPIIEEDKTAFNEFRRVFNILWIRNAFLIQEAHDDTVLDDDLMRVDVALPFSDCTQEDIDKAKTKNHEYVTVHRVNRNYITFCAFYFGEIMRRLYYYDVLTNNNMNGADFYRLMRSDGDLSFRDELAGEIEHQRDRQRPFPHHPQPRGGSISFNKIVENTKNWVEGFVKKFAEEAFEDMYVSTCEKGYKFVGDDAWLTYRWPNQLKSRGACISRIRPHLYKRFFSEGNINPGRVLKTIKSSYTSRLFILNAIDEQLRMRKQIDWFNAVVVTSNAIEMSAYKLRTDQCPIILQVFSNFYTYDKGRIYKCDNDIYKAIAVWFYLLNTRYHNHLLGVDLTEFVRTILRQEDEQQVINGELVGEL